MAEDATPAARTAPVSATPVPLLALDTFGSSYSQRSSLSSISGSDACSQRTTTPVQQKQARLRTARQRQLEQRREGVAASMLLHSSLQRACAACHALQRWRRFAEADAPNPPALASPAAVPATPRTGGCAAPQSASSAPSISPERHAEVLAGLQAAAEALEQAEARARAERRLLRAELHAETLERLDHAQRQHQSDLLAHVYEKQAAAAVHQKALQQAANPMPQCPMPNAQCPMPLQPSQLPLPRPQP
jgi:hypothetical protein